MVWEMARVVRPKLGWNTEFIKPMEQESIEITYGK